MLTAEDLISPYGIIQAAWFPGQELTNEGGTGLVDVWLAKAATKTESEAAQEAFVNCAARRAYAASLDEGGSLKLGSFSVSGGPDPAEILAQARADCEAYRILSGEASGPVITAIDYA